MSQQHMEYDEPNRQSQATPFDTYDAGYREPVGGTAYTGQKLYAQMPVNTDKTRMGMRLALAIVSLALLVPLAGIIFGILGSSGDFLGPIYGLIAMGLVCITVMVVNYFFSRH